MLISKIETIQIKVSIIIVNYNTANVLQECIQSINTHSFGFKYEIIVIDNNSTDNSKEIVDAFEDKITSYFLLYNSGFSFANNYGINRSSGEYILLLNPDTYLQNNAILDMIDYLDENKHVGVMGPLFINTQGIEYLPYSNFPNLRQQIFETFFIKKWLKKIERTKTQQVSLKNKIPFSVDWVSGACLLFQRAVFDKVGGLNEKYHIFYEDVDWCKRIKTSGWDIYCVPNISIIHHGSIAIKKNYFKLVFHRYRSKLIYAKDHFSYIGYIILRIILIHGLLIRLIGVSFKYYNNPKEKKQRLAGYYVALNHCIGIIKNTSRLKE